MIDCRFVHQFQANFLLFSLACLPQGFVLPTTVRLLNHCLLSPPPRKNKPKVEVPVAHRPSASGGAICAANYNSKLVVLALNAMRTPHTHYTHGHRHTHSRAHIIVRLRIRRQMGNLPQFPHTSSVSCIQSAAILSIGAFLRPVHGAPRRDWRVDRRAWFSHANPCLSILLVLEDTRW